LTHPRSSTASTNHLPPPGIPLRPQFMLYANLSAAHRRMCYSRTTESLSITG
jgi:hypothetical protein